MDLSQGFLPACDPLIRLPEMFDGWEALGEDLPKLLVSNQLQGAIDEAPEFAVAKLRDERDMQRAMVLLSFLGHAYVWGNATPASTLPAVLARPWYKVATRLERPPVLSYDSYAIHNWRRLDEAKPIELGNIALIQNFLAGIDEEWFILVHVEIEAKAASGVMAIPALQQAVSAEDVEQVRELLQCVQQALLAICDVLDRMPEHCDPYIYFNRVRPYIHGWKDHPALPEGVIYQGVAEYENKPQQFRGETGAQSGIIPSFDALLGIQHSNDPLAQYLKEMRDYMPPRTTAIYR